MQGATEWIKNTWEGSKGNNDELCLSQPLPFHLATGLSPNASSTSEHPFESQPVWLCVGGVHRARVGEEEIQLMVLTTSLTPSGVMETSLGFLHILINKARIMGCYIARHRDFS